MLRSYTNTVPCRRVITQAALYCTVRLVPYLAHKSATRIPSLLERELRFFFGLHQGENDADPTRTQSGDAHNGS